jgi:hypothetical protein
MVAARSANGLPELADEQMLRETLIANGHPEFAGMPLKPLPLIGRDRDDEIPTA